MLWIYLAILGFFLGAAVNILDKFILSEKKLPPLVYVFYSTALAAPLLILAVIAAPVGSMVYHERWLAAILASAGFFAGLYTMYRGFAAGEISHGAPFIGALSPMAVFFLAAVFLPESFTPTQILSLFFLIVGSLIMSWEKTAARRGWHRGWAWLAMSAFCFAVFNVGSKYLYTEISITRALFWIWGLIGCYGLLTLLAPSVRGRVFASQQSLARRTAVPLVVGSKILALVSVLLIQWAISLGSVTIVNALAALQYALLITAVFGLSKFWPRLFKEQYLKGEMTGEFIGVAVIAVGLTLLFI